MDLTKLPSAPEAAATPAAVRLFHRGNRQRTSAGAAAARAETSYRAALRESPGFAEALANLGLILEARGAAEEAEHCYRQALVLRCDLAEVHMNLGALLAGTRRHEEAAASYSRAIVLAPESAAAWSNLGALLAGMRHDDHAEAACRQALTLDAGFAKARFNLGYLLLRQGRLEEGFACLEARDWYGALAARLTCPRWNGEPLAGRSLLLVCEAGHGDVIQFCRYAALLKARWPVRITLLCQPALKTLLATVDGIDRLIGLDEPFAADAWDVWAPLLSLPHHLGTRLGSIPADLPYLNATPERIATWQPRLPPRAEGRVRVGLVWKGNSRFENDAERSLPHLSLLAPLGRVGGVDFVSLQKGAGEDEAAACATEGLGVSAPAQRLALCELGSRIGDFADTAAIVAQLDLVISVDTAAAHLAGALGTPCWVLLPDHMSDWRWLDQRNDTPWYPDVMRLFRQPRGGGWAGVIEQLVQALQEFVAG